MSDIEKGPVPNGSTQNYDLKNEDSRDEALQKIRTAGGLTISPELFEKIYLSPKTRVKGDLRAIVGNPTPLGLLGFLLSLSPLSCQLMGWRGSGGNGTATVGVFYFIGGLLMLLSGILEFILGNTFTFVVLGSFGGFWFSMGATLTPFYGATSTPQFNESFAFYYLFWGILCFMYLICSLRTNIVFMVIFLTLTIGFELLAGASWQLANGNTGLAHNLNVAAGAFVFVSCLAGWYLVFVQLLASVDFPFTLPVGDTSHLIKGASEKKKE
ncbi:transcriptional activator of ethanol catabolism AlcS [Thermoascus aurantiacus ATCC 26904]